ncbi:MAG TPA: hypothetical protein VD973_02460 [Symbiobacteriaceae bacterium]|nr:hypothetical protein [Symbiobacteriaceae bacterium]
MSSTRSDGSGSGSGSQKSKESEKFMAPLNHVPPQDDAAAKIEEIINEVKRTGRPVINDSNMVLNTKGTQEIRKGMTKPASVRLEGPAMALLTRLGDRRLSKTVASMGRQVNRVHKVRASVKPGTKIVFMWETDEEDNNGILVHRSGSTTSINLADVLIPLHLSIDSGHYETFALEFSEPTDAVYPALKFDMSKKIDSGLTSEEKMRRAVVSGKVAPKPKKKTPDPGPELQAPDAEAPEDEETE